MKLLMLYLAILQQKKLVDVNLVVNLVVKYKFLLLLVKLKDVKLCWGEAQAFLTQGKKADGPSQHLMLWRAKKMVHMETQWPQRESRQIPETSRNIIRDCQNVCLKAIAIRQYID